MENIEIIKGATKTFNVYLIKKSDNEPLNITDATEIEALFCKNDSTLLTKSLGSGVSKIHEVGGKIQVSLDSTDTEDLLEDERQDFEIAVTFPSDKYIIQFKERLNVYARLSC